MKRRNGEFWLYARILALNIAVVGMFIVVSQTPSPPVSFTIPKILVSKQTQPIKSGIPNRIIISSLGMDLAVGMGSYDPNSATWKIDSTKAYYADISIPVNNKNGTTVIYGHNQEPVFGKLHNIQPKAKATVYSDNGYRFNYVYQSMRQVLPNDTSVFQDNSKPVLVLLTCSGGWDTYRSLYAFNLESVAKL